MDGPARVPPRFVPTLTAVVDLDEQPQPPAVAAQPALPEPVQEPVPPAPLQQAGPVPEPDPGPQDFRAISPIDEADAFRLEEELLHRVLQRVDLSLEDRLTEVVSAAVQQQLDAMVPRLRQEVEAALRQLVVEAMARELSETPGSGARSHTALGLN